MLRELSLKLIWEQLIDYSEQTHLQSTSTSLELWFYLTLLQMQSWKKTKQCTIQIHDCLRKTYVFHTGDPQDAQETSPAPGMRDQFHFNLHSVGFILEQETTREDNKCLFRHLYATQGKTVSKISLLPTWALDIQLWTSSWNRCPHFNFTHLKCVFCIYISREISGSQ